MRDLDEFVASLEGDPRLVHVARLPSRPARFSELRRPLPEEVWSALGVDRLWTHQAEAIDAVRDGRSVVVVTGTASGKSLCFQAPIADAICSDRPASALLLYPTKALAQDQLRSLTGLGIPGLTASTYDGDTSPEQRRWVRRRANVILTNPDMLHSGILPRHDRWADFLHRLEIVVIDELHTLRGVFGGHVAHLLRRLRRLCALYGSDPRFVFTSATIGDAGTMATTLSGLPVVEIDDDGSPRGERIMVLWDPTAGDPDPEARTSHDTARLTTELVRNGHRTITFCQSRKGTEIVAAEVRRNLPKRLAESVRSYRGGYLADERREIERELFDEKLRGVVTTTALELGIDVGGLDACVLDGFPGTVASMWQQAGRAGRSGRRSLTALVAGRDQLDHWFVAHPDELLSRPPEPIVINPANPQVMVPQLACAAYEHPLSTEDERWWPGMLDDGVRILVQDDLLRLRPERAGHVASAVWAGDPWPASRIDIRSAGGGDISITTKDGQLVGTVDRSRAMRLVHPGATYLHQGTNWRVVELLLDDHVALVEPFDGDEYTQPRVVGDVSIVATDDERTVGAVPVGLGAVRVHSQVTGYRRLHRFTGELLGTHELDLPATELVTRGFWFGVDDAVIASAGVGEPDLPGALHAAEHAAIGILPLFTICDRWDVGGLSTPFHPDLGLATIIIHDAQAGGAGIAELGFDSAAAVLRSAHETIRTCTCADGCPSCVQSPKCGNGNEPLAKEAARSLLLAMLGE